MPTAMEDMRLDDGEQALSLWVDKLDDMVNRQQGSLTDVAARVRVSSLLVKALQAIASGVRRRDCETETATKLLTTTKVMMRDRRGIQELLTVETLELFLRISEGPDVLVAEEALKCVINSVYSRPEFVRDQALPYGFHLRLLDLARRSGPASMHLMVWKALLVSCESSEMTQILCRSTDAWKLIHATLHYLLRANTPSAFPTGHERANLALELLKLIAVVVNDLRLSPVELESQVELIRCLQQLGDVLLETLAYVPPIESSLSTTIVDIKNKTMEIFMFVRPELLGFFVQKQNEALSAILEHMYSMLVLIRIEKTRLIKELQPVLIACHHLTSTGDPGIRAFFNRHLFPPPLTGVGAGASASDPMPRRPAPPAFFQKHLMFFLTCLDTNIKRYMGEWLYLLCDQNADEYTRRTGIGNAIGLLRIKGLA